MKTFFGETLLVKRVDKELPLPEIKTQGSVGYDVFVREDTTIPGKGFGLIPLNVVGYPKCMDRCFIGVLPRGSTFRKTGLMLANSIGVVDNDYCGDNDEIMAFVHNTKDDPVTVKKGDRLFQLVLLQVRVLPITEVDHIADKDRGGNGSTDSK